MTIKKLVRSDDALGTGCAHARGMTRAAGDSGATAVEYALMVALIAIVISVSVAVVGFAVRDLFVIPCQALGGCGAP